MITGLLAAFIVGLFLAAANYLVLWFTVKRLVDVRKPAFLALASFFARMAFVILGFYAVTGGDPARLVACVLGFMLVRVIAVRRVAPAGTDGGSR